MKELYNTLEKRLKKFINKMRITTILSIKMLNKTYFLNQKTPEQNVIENIKLMANLVKCLYMYLYNKNIIINNNYLNIL